MDICSSPFEKKLLLPGRTACWAGPLTSAVPGHVVLLGATLDECLGRLYKLDFNGGGAEAAEGPP